MSSVNKVILLGNLGGDPEQRFTGSGKSVVDFSLATSESWGSGDNRQEKTEWHNIVVWDKLSESCVKYLHKGSKVYIEGRIGTQTWDDKDGNKHYKTVITATEVKFLDPKPEGGSAARGKGRPAPEPVEPEDDPFANA